MFGRNTDVEIPTTDLFIDYILIRVPSCPDHPQDMPEFPCHIMYADKGGRVIRMVCNRRARAAGYVGEPKPPPKSKRIFDKQNINV